MTPSASHRISAFTKLAGFALAQLRTVMGLAGPVATAAFPNRAFMVQPGPRAVLIVASSYPLSVEISHRGSSCVEILSIMERMGHVPKVLGGARDSARI